MLWVLIKTIGVLLFLYLTWRKLADNYKDSLLIEYSWLGLFAFLLSGRLVFGITHWGIWNNSVVDWLLFWQKSGFDYYGGVFGLLLVSWYFSKRNDWRIWAFFEEMTVPTYWWLIIMLLGELGSDWPNWKLFANILCLIMGLFAAIIFRSRYRSFSWYKSGKSGFVFFAATLVTFILLTVSSLLFKDRWLVVVWNLACGLLSTSGLIMLGDVIEGIELFGKRKNNAKK